MRASTKEAPVIPAALLTPSRAELDAARVRIGDVGAAFSAGYAALGLAATGLAGVIRRALAAGDIEAVAVAVRRLEALDQAAAERRAAVIHADQARPALRVVGGR
ncbi:hypothetical protein [Pseudofrankia inefficax]|uniref:Uncharacterized protein n=1 Tax=Pseudofrankia inefficax (strain DSM 45817 / CECT 9037 / DDB 130130 / EuI1c) TaxID=298654 RepID=E3J667_PSEI1|nr:hypothetical protein [Pseudofrankia inefficax]ADP78358.1 hypothetical protein FraEuI1c_0272 [Pseudofrankia inefficax]